MEASDEDANTSSLYFSFERQTMHAHQEMNKC